MYTLPKNTPDNTLLQAGRINEERQFKEVSVEHERSRRTLGELLIRKEGEHPEKFKKEAPEDAPVVQMVNNLLSHAAGRDASDIHLEPTEKGLRVRLRIDGVLRDLTTYSREVMLLIISRLKIMAGMDIAEKRRPQDGNIQFMLDKKHVNVRISTLPTINGKNGSALLSPIKSLCRLRSWGLIWKTKSVILNFWPMPLAWF